MISTNVLGTAFAASVDVTAPAILHCGNCERLKAGTHALALLVAATCGAYNLSAWLVRRQRHLAVNAIVYGAAVGWEMMHVQHHLEKHQPARRTVE